MIKHKTIDYKTGISHKRLLEAYERTRLEAESFIENELSMDQIISISESAVLIPLGMTSTMVSTTVWYNDKRGG